MSVPSWPEVLPVLAARVADDTGRDVAEVAEILDRAQRAEPAEVDVDELVELLAPTMASLVGPVLLDCLSRLEGLTREGRMPFLAPLVLGILPGMVIGVQAAERSARGIP
ncbi:hypothetical protein ACWENQ_44860 [Nonomuraea sp. NPDC004354]